MKNPRIVFFGTSDFSVSVLDALLAESYHVVAAVAQPDRPSGRRMQIKPTPVHAFCMEHGIDCLRPEKLKEAVEEVLAYEPDLILTCAYGQIVPESILNAPRYGCLNIHPSLLPKYRGGAPIHHAIWNGDKETGVCLMEMVKRMDAGKVYACIPLAIGPDETTEELTVRLKKESENLIRTYLPQYLAGKLPGVEQDEEKVVIARNISKEEEQVSFRKESLDEAYNHIRAMIDWPISYGMIDGKRIKFFRVRKKTDIVNRQPGTVIGFADQAMEIACTGGILQVYELQPEGKKPMSAEAFFHGAGRALIGHTFE